MFLGPEIQKKLVLYRKLNIRLTKQINSSMLVPSIGMGFSNYFMDVYSTQTPVEGAGLWGK
jgi:hypothetical protein